MKLKEFNSENTRVIRSGVPAIGVNQKTGVFNLNQLAADQLKLKDKDSVVFHQDQQAPENWYIEKVKQNGFTVRGKYGEIKGVLFNNATIARQIGESLKIKGSYRMLVSGVVTTVGNKSLYGLLIRAN